MTTTDRALILGARYFWIDRAMLDAAQAIRPDFTPKVLMNTDALYGARLYKMSTSRRLALVAESRQRGFEMLKGAKARGMPDFAAGRVVVMEGEPTSRQPIFATRYDDLDLNQRFYIALCLRALGEALPEEWDESTFDILAR